MVHNNALSPKEKNLNGKSVKLFEPNSRSLKVTIPLATAAFCLLNSNQVALATDFDTQIATNKATFSHFSVAQNHSNTPSEKCQHHHHSSGLLPRIWNLVASHFKNQTTNLAEVTHHRDPSQDIFQANGMGGSSIKNPTPIYLSQAENNVTKEFFTATKLKSIQPSNSFNTKVELQTYKVQTGDTVNSIAQKHQVSRQDLIALNKIKNSNIIFVGWELKIPTTKPNKIEAEKITLTSIDLPANAETKITLRSAASNYLADAKLNSGNISKLNVKKNAPATVSDEDRLAKLREEIEQMRSEYQNKTRQEGEKSIERLDVATSVNLETKQNLDAISQEAVALKLPPLPSSEEYLPDAFDGYSWPAQGVLTSGYGWRWGRLHKGIDIAAPVGTPVFAAAAGKVVSAGWNSGGYGNLIKLQHLDGSITVYAHNDKIMVRSGQKVRQGEQIAEMGNTGFSTGSHLHFEIHSRNNSVINPLALLSRK